MVFSGGQLDPRFGVGLLLGGGVISIWYEFLISKFNKKNKMKTLISSIENWLKTAAKADIQALFTYLSAVLSALMKGAGISGITVPVTSSAFINTLDTVLGIVMEFLPVNTVVKNLQGILITIEGYLEEGEEIFTTLIAVAPDTAEQMITAGSAVAAPVSTVPSVAVKNNKTVVAPK